MSQIDTKGMQVAEISESQLKSLQDTEKHLNNGRKESEIYLLAVTR